MSIYALLRNADRDEGYCLTPEDVELQGALDGNLCRCTGYRPILDAAKSFVGEYLKGKGRPVEGAPRRQLTLAWLIPRRQG